VPQIASNYPENRVHEFAEGWDGGRHFTNA